MLLAISSLKETHYKFPFWVRTVRLEPGTAGCEARTLLVCYGVPQSLLASLATLAWPQPITYYSFLVCKLLAIVPEIGKWQMVYLANGLLGCEFLVSVSFQQMFHSQLEIRPEDR